MTLAEDANSGESADRSLIALAVLATLPLARAGWRATCIAAGTTVAPLGAWTLWHSAMAARGPVSTLPDQTSYLAWIPSGSAGEFVNFVFQTVYRNVPVYLSDYGRFLLGWNSAKTSVVAAVLLLLTAFGLLCLARRLPALVATLVAAVAVIVVWPYTQDRLLTPILPVAGLAAAYAAQRVLQPFPLAARISALAIVTVVSLYSLNVTLQTRYGAVTQGGISPLTRESAEIAKWVGNHTNPGDHIMAPWGAVLFLRTGRQTSLGDPEVPLQGASEIDDAPLRFYANRLLADSVNVLVFWDRGSGASRTWIHLLDRRCPGLLSEWPVDTTDRPSQGIHYFHVRPDLPCVGAIAR